ncbi:hypothetical protein ThidrDRAFT_3551 [Thiorhodococcus drewsii AZ1]|uniref:Uncharacterized protein n=1 Tax=Thiorhodococcus drewsii AZ1 TaxID=765913 RepID=G2E5I8_9GAMM|nr:hypothetical protein [Thiorhodococcus drewsii]EGV28657.1 hypothetical protein ThidrDRAFT_3551 [Thiorhodococcus drewsii AZ1]
MQERPEIKTAIPKRRYGIGKHTAVLLGDIETDTPIFYRYILAFVPQGQTEPVLYVCAEQTPPAERADGAYRLRVIGELMSDLLDTSDGWGDIDSFADQGLKVGVQMLGLDEAQVTRLM